MWNSVSAWHVLLTPKGTKAAGRDANVGVVNVPVDVEVGSVGVHPLADMVGQPPDGENVTRAIERQRIFGRKALLRHHLFVDGLQPRLVGLKGVDLSVTDGM
jgi:hypothetical protein